MAPSWLHPASTARDAVEAKLASAGGDNGTFLVRKRENEGEWVLSVTFRGKPTHHLCNMVGGKVMINKKNVADAGTIEEAIARLTKDPLPPGWPVKLLKGCNTDGSSGAPGSGGGGAAARKASKRSSVSGGGKPWLSGPMAKDAASNFLKTKSNGDEGDFFVRPRGADHPDNYVVCVIYKGNPTHHLVTKADGKFLINNKPTGSSTLAGMIKKLSSKQPYWPVPLSEREGRQTPGRPPQALGRRQEARRESDPRKHGSWFRVWPGIQVPGRRPGKGD